MTSKPTNKQTTNPAPKTTNPSKSPPKKKAAKRKRTARRQPSRQYTAEEKAQAVLAAWTETLNQSAICRELGINYVTFQSWQKRAMEGMLQALESHARLADGAALSPRLRKLIETRRSSPPPGLDQRLRQIQQDQKEQKTGKEERDSHPLA